MEDVTIWGYNYLENLKPEIVGKGFSLEGELNFKDGVKVMHPKNEDKKSPTFGETAADIESILRQAYNGCVVSGAQVYPDGVGQHPNDINYLGRITVYSRIDNEENNNEGKDNQVSGKVGDPIGILRSGKVGDPIGILRLVVFTHHFGANSMLCYRIVGDLPLDSQYKAQTESALKGILPYFSEKTMQKVVSSAEKNGLRISPPEIEN